MFDLVRKLMMARELKMEEGEIVLFGERIQMSPAQVFVNMFKGLKEPELSRVGYLQYAATKSAISEWFANVAKTKEIKREELLKWETNVWKTAGWGNIFFNATDFMKGRVSCRIENSPFAQTYIKIFGKSKIPVCHNLRGGLAGGCIAVTGMKDIEAVEKTCMAQGSPHCEFILRPRKELEKVSDINIRKQLDLTSKK
jgi:predicted hydrocarbon binding protein